MSGGEAYSEALRALSGRLQREGLTCILQQGERVLTSTQRGVAPLVAWLDAGEAGGIAADKVVGRAAAFLYVLLGVRAVFAGVMSEGGRRVLSAHGIHAEYGALCDVIINRAGTGMCPMEEAVRSAVRPEEALALIRRRQRELRGGKPEQ